MNVKYYSSSIRIISILLMISIIIPSGLLLINQNGSWLSYDASADSLCNTLSSGASDVTLTFGSGGGVDTSAKLKIPKGSEVLSASFNVTGLPDDSGSYPRNVQLDVGDDGDLEWEFNLSSVGALGDQTEFIGEIQNKVMTLNKGESDNSLVMRLPRDADILSGDLDVHGFCFGLTNGNFTDGSMNGWTITRNTNSDTVVVQNNRGGNDPQTSWGTGNYLMLKSNPYGSHDSDCDLIVESDPFPIFDFDVEYVTMDYDYVEHDNFNLYIRILDEQDNYVEEISVGGDNNNDHSDSQTKQVIDVRSLPGNALRVRLRLWDGDSWFGPWNDWGRLAVDNIYISDSFGNKLYPTHVTVDVGNDGSKELTVASLTSTSAVPGLVSALNSLLSTPSPACQVTLDKYGNEFLDIPVNVTIRDSPGILDVKDLGITYVYKAEVYKNPKGTLVDELNSLIPSSGTGDITIPIAVRSSTPGKFKISEINIVYNAAPTTETILTIDIDEDSLNPHKLDLIDHFSDDSTFDQLLIEVASNSAPDKLEVIIEENRYLTLNANQAPNWNGDVTIILRATDSRGLMVESNQFIVRVLPVNDEPRVSVPISRITLWEDSAGTTLALDDVPYFTDVEGDQLYYTLVVDPGNIFPDISSGMTIYINGNNELIIEPASNWYGYSIPIFLYCDDDDDPIDTNSSSPQQQILVDVISVNDAPVLESFDTLYLDEDQSIDNWVKLTEKATDIETSSDNLVFTVLSNDNSENILVTIDDDKYLDVTINNQDYVGSAKVKLQVMDEGEATAEVSFKIIINSINDGPRILKPINTIQIIEDTIDSSTMNLYDVFYDPDSPMKFSVVGNQYISITLWQDNGTVIFKPDKDWFGSEKIIFTALDTLVESGSSQQTADLLVNVTVLPVNDPPAKPKILSPLEPRANPSQHEVLFKADTAQDVDSTEFKYYWDFDNRVDTDGDGDPTNDCNGIGREIQYEYSISGYYYVTLFVSDGELNCTEPAGIYVKVTTNLKTATEELVDKESTFQTEIILTIPFILIVILLIIWILLIRRRSKRDSLGKEQSIDTHEQSKPPVLEGELISEPKPRAAPMAASLSADSAAAPKATPVAGSPKTPPTAVPAAPPRAPSAARPPAQSTITTATPTSKPTPKAPASPTSTAPTASTASTASKTSTSTTAIKTPKTINPPSTPKTPNTP